MKTKTTPLARDYAAYTEVLLTGVGRDLDFSRHAALSAPQAAKVFNRSPTWVLSQLDAGNLRAPKARKPKVAVSVKSILTLMGAAVHSQTPPGRVKLSHAFVLLAGFAVVNAARENMEHR